MDADPPPSLAADAPVRRRPLRHVAATVALGGALAAAAAAWQAWDWWDTLPSVESLAQRARHTPSRILARDGQVLRVLSSVHRRDVALDAVAPVVVDALLATEDRRFATHRGVDPRRIAGAAWATLHGRREGGSTLTQQLARNLYADRIGRAPTLERKAREALLALRIEQRWSKPEILQAYLNTASFGHAIVGIEMAAHTYFSRPAAQLDAAQAATLVGMLKATSSYHPVHQPQRALARRNLVLRQMVRDGRLPPAALAALQARPLGLAPDHPDVLDGPAGHFVAQVQLQLQQWAAQHGRDLERDALQVHTTLDPALQDAAEAALRTQVAQLQQAAGDEWAGDGRAARPFDAWWSRHRTTEQALMRTSALWPDALRRSGGDAPRAAAMLQRDPRWVDGERPRHTRLSAGLLALDPRSGAVRAWVGSPDFRTEPLDHVAGTRRQPGSAFKPFVYGAALAQGIDPMQVFADVPVQLVLADGRVWQPRDTHHTGDWVPMADALAQSRNGITAQVMDLVGPYSVIAFARAAGIRQAALAPVPSLALGSGEVSLLELTQGYATIAAGGTRHAPMLIERIEEADGRVADWLATPPERALPAQANGWLLDMLRGPIDRGTARALRSDWGVRGDIAGKTGTSQRHADGWFVALRPDLVVGAWVGFNDARVHFRTPRHGLAARNALPLVGRFLRQAQAEGHTDAALAFRTPPMPTRPAIADTPVAVAQLADGGTPTTPDDSDIGSAIDADDDTERALQEWLDRDVPSTPAPHAAGVDRAFMHGVGIFADKPATLTGR